MLLVKPYLKTMSFDTGMKSCKESVKFLLMKYKLNKSVSNIDNGIYGLLHLITENDKYMCQL